MQTGSEIVIGITQPVGVNSSEVVNCITDCFKQFRFKVNTIKVSRDIIAAFDTEEDHFDDSEYRRISHYMDMGNKLRKETEDDAFLMRGVVAHIYQTYHRENGPQVKMAYVVDSIKHPQEVQFLRNTYKDGFHLVGISNSQEARKNYLMSRKGLTEKEADSLLLRDYDEEEKSGQHTRDVYQQADYFINAGAEYKMIESSIFRLLDLIFGNAFITPTFGEYAMFRAYVASLRSADLSRQIGAVVTNKHDEIIAEGVNDCPKFGGGLYWPAGEEGGFRDIEGGRDYTLGYDSNKIEQEKIIDNIIKKLDIVKTEEAVKKIKKAGIGELTEYGRVVHAEMEALLMCARNNNSTRGCSMYVTTFPCHNCAKHIIAAGIERVYYIEPYPKSKALDFYKIEIGTKNEEKRLLFSAFSGVGPHRFMDLFSMSSILWYKRTRKGQDGRKLNWSREQAKIRNPMPLLTYIEIERKAYKEYFDRLKRVKGEL